MRKFEFDQRTKSLSLFGVGLLALIICIIMVMNGLERFTVSGTKNEKGRIEILTMDHFLYFYPFDVESIAPVTNARLFKEAQKDSTENKLIVLYTIKGEFKLKGFDAGLNDDEITALYDSLTVFIESADRKIFQESYFETKMSGFIGLVLGVLSVLFMISQFKQIPRPIVNWKKTFEVLIALIKKIKLPKKAEKTGEVKQPKKSKSAEPGENPLKVLIPVYDPNVKYNIDLLRIPEAYNIALACTSEQQKEFKEQYGDEFDYIICDDLKGSADMLNRAQNWLKNFTGYLIVQAGNLPPLTSSKISEFFKDHRQKDSACSFITIETSEKKIPIGKIIKNVANRIMKISDIEENNDSFEQSAEVFAGLFCFNSKNLLNILAKLNIGTSSKEIPLTKIVEMYYKSNSRISTFPLNTQKQSRTVSGVNFDNNPHTESKINLAALILAAEKMDISSIKKHFDAVTMAEIEEIGIIIQQDLQSEVRELLGTDVKLIYSDGSLGDGDDAFKAHEHFKKFVGNIIVVPEIAKNISKELIAKILSEHTDKNNTCTFVKDSEKIILYCVNSEYFFYAVKRIIRDDDTRKYLLPQIVEILENDKKRVQEIQIDEI